MRTNELDDESLKRSTCKLTHNNYRLVQRVIASVKSQSSITLSQAEVINLLIESVSLDAAMKGPIGVFVNERLRELRAKAEQEQALRALTDANPGLIEKLASADPDKLVRLLESL